MFPRLARPLLVPRRTLFATPLLSKASQSTPKTPKKDPKAKASKATKVKDAKPERKRVPKALQPPKRAPTAYLLFYTSFLKSQGKVASMQEVQQVAKRASQLWNGYSMREKQPYFDESEARKAQAKQAKDEFFSKTSSSDLRQLNAIRKRQGKAKVHSTLKLSVPLSPFFAFSSQFRNSPEGQTIINDSSDIGKNYTVRAAMAAGRRWRSMSEQEKAPYLEEFKKEKDRLQAEKAQS